MIFVEVPLEARPGAVFDVDVPAGAELAYVAFRPPTARAILTPAAAPQPQLALYFLADPEAKSAERRRFATVGTEQPLPAWHSGCAYRGSASLIHQGNLLVAHVIELPCQPELEEASA